MKVIKQVNGHDNYLTVDQKWLANNGYKFLPTKRLIQFWNRLFRQMGFK